MIGATAASDLLQSHAMKREGDLTVARGLAKLPRLVGRQSRVDSFHCLPRLFVLRVYGPGASGARMVKKTRSA
jgi:hypothetical protein